MFLGWNAFIVVEYTRVGLIVFVLYRLIHVCFAHMRGVQRWKVGFLTGFKIVKLHANKFQLVRLGIFRTSEDTVKSQPNVWNLDVAIFILLFDMLDHPYAEV